MGILLSDVGISEKTRINKLTRMTLPNHLMTLKSLNRSLIIVKMMRISVLTTTMKNRSDVVANAQFPPQKASLRTQLTLKPLVLSKIALVTL